MPPKNKKQSKKQSKKLKFNLKTAKNKPRKNKKILTKKRRVNLEKRRNKKAHNIILDEIKKPKVVIVMFFAEWCPHCHNLVPVFNNIANKVYQDSSMNNILVGSVDCTRDDNQSLNDSLDIMGYPTIKLYKNGKYVSDYNGPRDENILFLTIEKLNK